MEQLAALPQWVKILAICVSIYLSAAGAFYIYWSEQCDKAPDDPYDNE